MVRWCFGDWTQRTDFGDRQVTKFQVFNPDDGTVKVMANQRLSGGVHNTVYQPMMPSPEHDR
jgi:hypothetical protein